MLFSGIGMEERSEIQVLRVLVTALLLAAGLSAASCGDNTDVTGANKSLVRLSVDAPDTARAGSNFGVQVRALNIGIANIQNGHVTITLPAPLTILGANASAGTSATFSNGGSGGTVEWDLRTLDSNSQSTIDITTMGQLSPGEATRRLTILATMTGQDIKPGDAVATDDVVLTQ